MKISLRSSSVPKPNAEQKFLLTRNLKIEDLKYLFNKKYKHELWSRDLDTTGKNAATEAIRMREILKNFSIYLPNKSASLALRTPYFPTDDTLSSYGHLVLTINPKSVWSDLVVFNGDAKNLVNEYDESPSKVVVYGGNNNSPEKVCDSLEKLHQNTIKREFPRLVGLYCEARLLRPIKESDINILYVQLTKEMKKYWDFLVETNPEIPSYKAFHLMAE